MERGMPKAPQEEAGIVPTDSSEWPLQSCFQREQLQTDR